MPKFNVAVYPIFVVSVKGVEADSLEDAASKVMDKVAETLNTLGSRFSVGDIEVSFADGFDSDSVVDEVM